MKTEQRVIKFRCWDTENKRMVYPDGVFHFIANGKLFKLDPLIREDRYFDMGLDVKIMQFTGLVDKEGNEIYEGDIVECYDHPTDVESTTGAVEFQHGYYNVNGHPLHDYGTAWTKVIGNIYQHKHLINEEAEN